MVKRDNHLTPEEYKKMKNLKKMNKRNKVKTKMKIPVLTLILVGVILITTTSINAELNSLGIFKINSNVLLKQSCQNSTYSNLSYVSYPNSTYIISGDYPMIKSGVTYSYNFAGGNVTILGDYIYCGHCDINAIDTTWCSDFLITNTGYQTNTSQSIVIFFVFGVMIIIGLLFFIFGMRVEMTGIKIFCLSMTVIILVFLIGYIMNLTNITLGEFPSLTSGFNALYILFIALLTVGAVGLVVYLISYSFQAFYKSRGWRD